MSLSVVEFYGDDFEFCVQFLFLLTPFTILLLFAGAVNELKMEQNKDRNTLKLNLYSTGIQLFPCEELSSQAKKKLSTQ